VLGVGHRGAGLDGLDVRARNTRCPRQLGHGDPQALTHRPDRVGEQPVAFSGVDGNDDGVHDRWLPPADVVHRDERARTKRSRRCRASRIVGSTPRSWAACLLSSRTARTRSATRSAGTLPSSSAERVSLMSAHDCVVSPFVGCFTPECGCGCGSRADGDCPLSKVVAGVVVRMGVEAPRPVHSSRSSRSG